MEPAVCRRHLLKGSRGQDLWSLACARGRGEGSGESAAIWMFWVFSAAWSYWCMLETSGGSFSWEVSIQGTVLQWHLIETYSLQLPQPRALQVSWHGWPAYQAHASLLIFKLVQFLPSRLGVGYKSGGGWEIYVAIRGIRIWTRRNREMHSRYASWESEGLGSTRWSAVSTCSKSILTDVVRAS